MHTSSWRTRFSFALLFAVALPAVGFAQRGGPQGPQQATTPEPLKFRYMGPAAAGRIASVAGVPGDLNTLYLGSASGGLWKTTDAGQSFKPIFDEQPVQAIGTISVADSNPSIVWVGTGEPWVIRYSDVMGDGVYVSKDAGATWKNMGLGETGRIARIIIHPTDPNIVYVCAEGRLTGPQEERGVFKTTDGGTNWKRVLFVDQKTGCSGLTIDAHDPKTLVAGTWQVEEHTWAELSGGPGSGVYMSHDAGETWTKITAGMPKSPVGKVDVAIAASDSKRIYALIQTFDQGSLWRSDDSGATWQTVSWDRSLIGRAGYYIRLGVNPQNPDDLIIMSSSMHRSVDGGKHFSGNGGAVAGIPQGAGCGDCHDVWFDSKDPVHYAVTDDGGASINTPSGTVSVRIPNGQMYHVHLDNRVPYWIYSNRQDDGTMRGPSTVSETTGNACLPEGSLMPTAPAGFGGRGGGGGRGRGAAANAAATQAAAPRCAGGDQAQNGAAGFGGGGGGGGRGRGGAALAWQPNIGGCESGFTIPDPTNADVVYASCYGNKVTRWDAKMGTARSIEPWEISLDSPPDQAKYRCHWTAPMAIDPFDTKNVLYGCQLILKTSNEGQSWTELSPDLSTKEPGRVVSSGGLVGDNLGQFDGEVVWDIEYSKIKQGLIWAGTNDGKLWYTRDNGVKWNDVSKNFKDLPPWGTFSQIWPSTFDAGAAYVSVDFHLMDDRKPYIYRTTDYGVTWAKITGNIPTGHPLDYILSFSGNPNKKGMLFAGSAHAFYYSMDDGGTWTQFKDGLPAAPVSWINVEPRFHDIAISTYGRGLFILPNISVLEQTGIAAPPVPTGAMLYDPAPVIRLARDVYQQPGRPHFTLALASAPSGPIKMEILNAAGKTLRTEQVSAHQGLNGINWDLRLDPPVLVALRTTPPENPHIWDEARFQNTEGIRRITHWGITPQTGIPMAAPGKYQVRFTVDGKTYTKPFDVIKDPAVEASDADLQLSTATQIQIRDAITRTSSMVNQMEIWRKQLEDQAKANQAKPDVAKALDAMNKKILDVELELVSRSEMLSDDKYFPEAYKAYMNLIWLSGGVGQGASDEAGSIDHKPTDTQLKVFTAIQGDVEKAEGGYLRLLRTEIPDFNKSMAGKVPPITDTTGGGK